jgi:Resolvase, N terminal domain
VLTSCTWSSARPEARGEGFCNSRHSPAARGTSGVQNPDPKSTSHNYPCHRVLQRSPHGTPTRLCSRLHRRPAAATPSRRPGAGRLLPGLYRNRQWARTDRPTLTQVLDQLRPGDTLVVWKLDRLGCSLRHLVDTATGLAERGVGFRSLQEAIDTTTPGGKLVFHVFAALAEFERDLIRERTAAGWPRLGPVAATAAGRR